MKKKVLIIDYGRGNLRSVAKALEWVGAGVEVGSSRAGLERAAGLILPGVGAFGDAMKALKKLGLVEAIQKQAARGKPLLGVCLGLQLLFERSKEFGQHSGLGFFKGTVEKFKSKVKVPHMGWNQVWQDPACPLFRGLKKGENFYFVHSYRAEAGRFDGVAATTAYGSETFISAVWRGSIFGTQFHPEKSQAAGLKLYSNYWSFVQKH